MSITIEISCSKCGGCGYTTEIGYEHSPYCDGTDEVCSRNCPIQVPVLVDCDHCNGSGKEPK